MHLTVAFEGHEPREVAVTDVSVVSIMDGITGEPLDMFSLDGVRGLFLVRDDGGPVLTGDGPAEQAGVTPEELARSLGWFSPEERQDLVDRVGSLESELGQAQRALEAHAQRAQQQEQESSRARGILPWRQ